MKRGDIMFTITAKIQILPTLEEQQLLLNTMRAYSKACNYVSEYIFKTHELKQAAVNKALYNNIRVDYKLRSQMAQSAQKTVIARYKTILETAKEWIKPVFKHPEYDLVWNRDYSLTSNLFSVNTLDGRIKLNYHLEGMEKFFDGTWQFGTAQLVNKHKKWFLHIPVSKDIPETQDFNISNVVGIDLGVNFLATAYGSNGKTIFFKGRKIKDKRSHYKELRRQLQHRQTASARRRLKKIGQRENRWMSDVNHQVSKALVESYPAKTLFAIEELTGIRGATEKVKRKDRYELVSWSFFDLRKKLEYKAWQYGSKVKAFAPHYTSQTCPVCGHTEKANRNKKLHIFVCRNCNYYSNDDRIGAMNLYRKGIEYLSTVTAEHDSTV